MDSSSTGILSATLKAHTYLQGGMVRLSLWAPVSY